MNKRSSVLILMLLVFVAALAVSGCNHISNHQKALNVIYASEKGFEAAFREVLYYWKLEYLTDEDAALAKDIYRRYYRLYKAPLAQVMADWQADDPESAAPPKVATLRIILTTLLSELTELQMKAEAPGEEPS